MLEKTKKELQQELINLKNNFEFYKSNVEKEYQTKIKESKYTFETIFQTNPDSVTVTKIDDGTIIQVNNSFLSITGYKREELIGKTTRDLNLWEDISERKKMLLEIEQRGYVTNMEAKFRLKDGSILTGLISGKTFEYNNEFCLLLITRDITDYKKMIDRAISNELRFRAFFSNNESGVSILDLKGNFKTANERMCSMLGYTLDELREKNYKDVTLKLDESKSVNYLKKLYSGEINSFTVQKRYIRKDKTYYWGEIFVSGIYSKNGDLIETIGIQIDITQRKYEAIKNRLKFELSEIIEKDYDNEQLYQNLTNILSKIFSVRDTYIAVIGKDNSINFINSKSIEKQEEILIRHLAKNKKSITINSDEFSTYFKKITGKKHKLKAYNWQGAPIFISGNVTIVLVIRLFTANINLSSKQIDLFEATTKIISDLLEKRKSIEEVKLFSQVLDQSPVIALITDINGNIKYVNKRTTLVTGYKQKELLNQNPRIFKSGKHKKEIYKELWDTVLAGETWFGDLLNKKKNGELFWSRCIVSPIKNSAGRIVHLVALNLDVTELKAAELESQKFNLFIKTSQDFIAFCSMEKQITYVNPGCRKMLGLSINEDITNFKIEDFLTEEGNKISTEKEIPTVIKKGYWTGEYTLRHFKTGKQIPVLANTFLIKNPETGDPIGMGTVQHDLTDKNEALKEVKQSEEKFRTLADNSVNMIYIFNKDKFLYANKMFSQKMEYSKEEIYSPKFDLFKNLIAPESKIKVKKGIEEHKAHKEIRPYEITLTTKTGKRIEAIDSSTIIRFNGKEAVMGILTDITDRKKMELEIITAKEKAEELSKLKSSFYANMSHELRTPLVGIMGASEILKEEIKDEELKAMASIIYSSGKRLTKTLNNILNLSKINSEKMELDLREINIVDTISERVEFFRNAAEKKGLKLKIHKENDFIRSILDNDKFIEIVDNILNNAIKFTKEGGINIDITNQKIKDRLFSVISIKDTGIGIASKYKKIIFDEYRQVSEGLARKYEGTGLGLTISKKYMELMNGTIEVESKLNEGANFILKFPMI